MNLQVNSRSNSFSLNRSRVLITQCDITLEWLLRKEITKYPNQITGQ